MCTSVCPVSLLAVVVIAWVVHPAPVVCQCTTGHCHDDGDGDNDVSVLTAMVSRLQDTVEQLQRQLHDSNDRQQQLIRDAREELQQLRESSEHQQSILGKQVELSKRWFAARDCYDLLRDGNNVSGVYDVYVSKARKFVRVYCDMDSDNGGWMVFQRRQDGSVDFYRDWASYKEGFGDVEGEFWLGNDYLNDITSQKRYVLRIDMEDFENEHRYAIYSNFAVASEINKYTLSLGAYSGTAGDSLTAHSGAPFSTKYRDNDSGSRNCAQVFKGAWWYTDCHSSNLNGMYLGGRHSSFADGIEWEQWHGYYYSLKKVEMKLRP